MVHQISADGVMNLHFERDLQLGTHAINARNQNRIGPLLFVNREHPAKASDFAEYITCESLMRKILDTLFGLVRALDVHTCVGVADRGSRGGVVGHGTLNPSLCSRGSRRMPVNWQKRLSEGDCSTFGNTEFVGSAFSVRDSEIDETMLGRHVRRRDERDA